MRTKLLLVAFVAGVLGLILPSWIIGTMGLFGLSILLPVAGVVLGFVMDIAFGVPSFLPEAVAYPFMLLSLVIGLISISVKEYLR